MAEPTGNYHSTDIGDANSPRTILSDTSTRSSVPSQDSFASASTTANTASTSRTSLGLSSSAHSMASGHTRQETVVATASTQTGSANTKPTMYCVCCWKSNADLTRHYRERRLYIHGNWAFWACPYTSEVFGDQQAFINHMKSFKFDEKRIAVTQTVYVTPRDWAVHFAEDAKKRQLVNTVLAYFCENPGLAREWKALNNGELVPDVNNVGDVGKILAQSSILRCRPPLGSAHSVQTVSIEQLRQLLQAGKAVVNSIPVPYNALQIVNRGSRVTIGDAHFDSAELAERQQQQLYREDQERSFRYGGIFVHSQSGTAALAPTNTSSTARTLSTCKSDSRDIHCPQQCLGQSCRSPVRTAE